MNRHNESQPAFTSIRDDRENTIPQTFMMPSAVFPFIAFPQMCANQPWFGQPIISPHAAIVPPLPPVECIAAFNSRMSFQSGLNDGVASCVTIGEDNPLNTTGGSGRDDREVGVASQMTSTSQNHPSALPLIMNPFVKSENLLSRQFRYRQRHHPHTETSPISKASNSELKNKNRFSATGAAGNCVVVRDCKMSLSSLPPSPTTGSWGGLPRNWHFTPISTAPPLLPVNYPAISLGSRSRRSPTQSVSPTMMYCPSATPTYCPSATPTYCPSTTPTSASQNRPTNEDLQRLYACTGNQVSKCVHPNCSFPNETNILEPPCCKKPKKQDDATFVSMAPTLLPSSPISTNSIRIMKNIEKRIANEMSLPVVKKTTIPGPSAVPKCSYHNESTQQSVQPLKPFVVLKPQFASASSAVSPINKGYFLRSTVKRLYKEVAVSGNQQEHQKLSRLSGPSAVRKSRKRKFVESKVSKPKPLIVQTPTKVVCKQSVTTHSSPIAITKKLPIQSLVSPIARVAAPPSSVYRSTHSHIANVRQIAASSSFTKRYDIKGKLGRGGGGVVYSGTRKCDNVEVAIKRISKEKIKRWGKLDGRVVPIEFELLHKAGQSGNKGIIRMYDWYERRSSYILVMERPQPVIDLFDYLNQCGPMTESCARNIFRQLVNCAMDCHEQGIIHRDIKDENVLLNLHTSEAKLIDFGCGAFLKPEPFTEFAGTFEFYPPEWYLHRRYDGKQVDAWSLGVLLFTMVEAEIPFPEDIDIVVCRLKFKRRKNPVSGLCRDLISSMLQKDPTKRLNLQQVLKHPWMMEDDLSTSSVSLKHPGEVSVSDDTSTDSSFISSTSIASSSATTPQKVALDSSSATTPQKAARDVSRWRQTFKGPSQNFDFVHSSPKSSPASSSYIPPTPLSPPEHEKRLYVQHIMVPFIDETKVYEYNNISPVKSKLPRSPCFVRS